MADITSGRYAAGQVHDVQRNPAFPIANSLFTLSGLQDPYRFNNTTYQLNPGEFVRLFFVGGTCSNGLVGINRYDASGAFLETVQSTGRVYGLSSSGFLHDNDSGYGTFFSTDSRPNGGSLTYTPTTGPAPETCASLLAYGVPRYTAGQVHDAQRNPAFPIANSLFTVSGLQDPYRFNNATYQLNPGESVGLFFVGGTCSNGLVGINRYDASGAFLETVQSTGRVYGLSSVGFLHDNDSGIGTFFSADTLPNGGSLTYTPTTGPAPETCASLLAYGVALPTAGVPTGLYVKSAAGNAVTFAWRANPGQMAATGHVLEGGLPGSTTPLASIDTGSAAPAFTLTVPNGSFWVRMRARAGSTVGAPSGEMPLCFNAGCPPASPTNLLGLANGSALSLGWRTPLESGVPSRISLQVSGAVSANLDLPGTAESFAFAGVPAGTYTFALTSCTAAGCSAPSSPVTLTFPGTCAGPPATPAGFSAGKSGSTLVLDWGLPASGSPPTSYVLAVSGAFTGSVSFATRGFMGAVPPGTYVITLAAANACGVSAPTGPLTVTVP